MTPGWLRADRRYESKPELAFAEPIVEAPFQLGRFAPSFQFGPQIRNRRKSRIVHMP
ncbi:hypothetical protein AGR4C_Cc50383 [Agrobacterium tumefaciens str. Kerr 14]|uniref:Uncharacterized protein n=1 Tax=Agrobacterium tumefaciens str. Kerr 14 TaxID=1183424 RepID=A0A1S7Q385_AGRTU|nr:hypothetical protein At12D1_04630 [Agrobacterium tumefaciens]CUX30567.1 hypothetical protein AGR4C_Cc50383 [Agrobacterium tumefaciens str. Kerr 14]